MAKTSPSNAGAVGLIPGWGAKIPHDLRPKNIKQKQYCNKFNKDFKNGPLQKNLKKKKKKCRLRTSLVVQLLRLRTPNAGGPASIPGQGTRSHMPQLRARMPQRRSRMLQLRPGAAKYIYVCVYINIKEMQTLPPRPTDSSSAV